MRPRYFAAALALALAAGGPARAQDDKEKEKITSDARNVLKTHCYRCHNARSSTPYKFDVTDHATLVKPVGGASKAVVVPGKPAASKLFNAVDSERMPQIGSQERTHFGPGQRDAIKKWIEIGAPPFALPGKDRAFIPHKSTLAVVRDHLRKVAKEDRPYMRYFTFTNLHNTQALSAADLDNHRAALSKVINSLSWAPRVVVPQVIDADNKTVLAINLKDIEWDKGNLWDAVFQAYPYGMKYTGHDDQELRDVDDEVRELSAQRFTQVVIRGDWFVSTASRPPLYYTLLYDQGRPLFRDRPDDPKNPANPKRMTAYDLEKSILDVDVADNFARDKLARGAFTQSGVSNQNRMVERHSAKYGAYWKSYDFLPDAGRGRFHRFPLGPAEFLSGYKNPYPHQAFLHDGGEAIFNLPNGLQGYLLMNGKDERIDAGPIQVVSDNNRVSGSFEIVNGVSCMACHAHGMIRFADELRDMAAVFGDGAQKVRRLHPEGKKMNEWVAEDEQKFLTAAKKAVLPFLAPDNLGMDDTEFKGYVEPVSVASIDYRLRYLDLKAIAVELDMPDPNKLAARVGEDRFKRLGLKHLLEPGGVISRADWESTNDGLSLMQEVASSLGAAPWGGTSAKSK